jgi:hypothetical protein
MKGWKYVHDTSHLGALGSTRRCFLHNHNLHTLCTRILTTYGWSMPVQRQCPVAHAGVATSAVQPRSTQPMRSTRHGTHSTRGRLPAQCARGTRLMATNGMHHPSILSSSSSATRRHRRRLLRRMSSASLEHGREHGLEHGREPSQALTRGREPQAARASLVCRARLVRVCVVRALRIGG